MAEVTSKKRKEIVLTNDVCVDGNVIRTSSYRINSENPSAIEKQPPYQVGVDSEALYKENRAQVRTLEAQFEDEAYALQDKMIAEKAAEVK